MVSCKPKSSRSSLLKFECFVSDTVMGLKGGLLLEVDFEAGFVELVNDADEGLAIREYF